MKKKNLLIKVWMWVTLLFIGLGIGGIFTEGLTLTYPILSIFPEIVHTLVGWGIIISVVIGAIMDFME